ncbi:hypothetical protein BDN67DRAFT_1018136 [Paxillus ammoniavirescens]|nr:hypothetical protein BDN67DRAFT_1018136 [Paxillus ammoniavirescens]
MSLNLSRTSSSPGQERTIADRVIPGLFIYPKNLPSLCFREDSALLNQRTLETRLVHLSLALSPLTLNPNLMSTISLICRLVSKISLILSMSTMTPSESTQAIARSVLTSGSAGLRKSSLHSYPSSVHIYMKQITCGVLHVREAPWTTSIGARAARTSVSSR